MTGTDEQQIKILATANDVRPFLVDVQKAADANTKALGFFPKSVYEELAKRGVSADSAVRLAAALGTSERFWLGLQADYGLEAAHRALGDLPKKIERLAV